MTAPFPKQYFEREAIATQLDSYLTVAGFSGINIKKGFQSGEQIKLPTVAVTMIPSRLLEMQMGRTGEKSYLRRVQIDCYMESEPRAMSMGDTVAEFLDDSFIGVLDPSSVQVGRIYVPDTQSIVINILQPNPRSPNLNRWRAVVQATMQADYDA